MQWNCNVNSRAPRPSANRSQGRSQTQLAIGAKWGENVTEENSISQTGIYCFFVPPPLRRRIDSSHSLNNDYFVIAESPCCAKVN